MQEGNAGNTQNGGMAQEKPKYGHYEVHQPQAGNYAGGSIPPKKPQNPEHPVEMGITVLAKSSDSSGSGCDFRTGCGCSIQE